MSTLDCSIFCLPSSRLRPVAATRSAVVRYTRRLRGFRKKRPMVIIKRKRYYVMHNLTFYALCSALFCETVIIINGAIYDAISRTADWHFGAGVAELLRRAGHRHPAVFPPVLPAAGAAGAIVCVGLDESARPDRPTRNLHASHAGWRAGPRAHYYSQCLATPQAVGRTAGSFEYAAAQQRIRDVSARARAPPLGRADALQHARQVHARAIDTGERRSIRHFPVGAYRRRHRRGAGVPADQAAAWFRAAERRTARWPGCEKPHVSCDAERRNDPRVPARRQLQPDSLAQHRAHRPADG